MIPGWYVQEYLSPLSVGGHVKLHYSTDFSEPLSCLLAHIFLCHQGEFHYKLDFAVGFGDNAVEYIRRENNTNASLMVDFTLLLGVSPGASKILFAAERRVC